MAQFARLRDLVNTAHLTLGALDGSIVIEPVMAAASEPSDPLGIALPFRAFLLLGSTTGEFP